MTLKQGYHWTRRFWRPSRQQRRVLDALVEGRTNPEIAALLDMTLDGAKWHVSNLFEKTDCETRQELAQWWQDHRDRYERSFVASPMLWFALKAIAGVGVIAIVASVIALLTFGLGRGGADPKGVFTQTTATPQGNPAAVPPPTPTATPAPTGALVFDTRDGSTMRLPGLYYSRRWLDANALTFVIAQGPAVIDAKGQQTAELGSLNSSEYVVGYANQEDGNVVVWRPQSGDLTIVNPGTKTQLDKVNLGSAQLQDRAWDVSVRGGRIALTEVNSNEIRVFTYKFDGTGKTELYRGGSDAWVTSLTWSPDGNRLLLLLGSRSNRIPNRFQVVDGTGRVLLNQPGAAAWAGASTVVVRQASPSQTTGYIDVISGVRSPDRDATRLLCVSPNGQFGVFYEDSGPTTGPNAQVTERLKDLRSGAVLASATLPRNMVDCDWTWDSTRAVMSPGGK